MRKLFLAFLICLTTLHVFAQDPMSEKFKLYRKANPNGALFVHFDKNVYSSNETVWFTGYLISSRDMNKHHLMSVSVIRETDNKVVFEDRFVMKNGFCFGNFNLPDSIAVGNYRLLAITDYIVNNSPEVSFTQSITIKSVLEPAFKASMKIMPSNNSKETKVMVSTTTADNRFLAKPAGITYIYGNITKTMQTDASGQAIITLPQLDNLKDGNLHVKLHYNNDSTSLNIPIVQPKGSPSVKFYPEGGNMISGLINNIGWEVKDRQAKSIAAKAYLYKNDTAIDTVNADAYGLGSFKLSVEDGAKYTLKVVGNNLKDTLFTLPNALKDGIVLNIGNAVVTDTLNISIQAKQAQQVGIRVHNFRESYLYTKFEIQPGVRTLKIPLTQVPKGLASLTLTNAEEQPLAERIFFAHYDNSEKVSIASDKTSYGIREKVNLKLNLKNISETAVVSIAVVQDNRMEPGKVTDIENFTYLNNELNAMPINTKGSTFKNKKYLEQLLLIKGWRKYNWQDLSKVKVTDTNNKFVNLLYTGTVTKSKKPLTKAVDVGAMGGEQIKLITTKQNGTFDFNTPQLYTVSGKKMFLFLSNKDASSNFSVTNQLLETSEKIAGIPSLDEKPPLLALPDNSELFIKSNEKSIRLQEVTITGKTTKGDFGPNACGDYVCRMNVLNCRNHYGEPTNRQPIAGRTYGLNNGQKQIYPGCNVTDESILFKTEGVHIHKEYYVDSYKDPQEPAYFSTIYWNYATILNKDKEATIDFYTSDIAGKYRIVVQGITQNHVIFNEKFFEVKRK